MIFSIPVTMPLHVNDADLPNILARFCKEKLTFGLVLKGNKVKLYRAPRKGEREIKEIHQPGYGEIIQPEGGDRVTLNECFMAWENGRIIKEESVRLL